jgi:hypothetical protein
MAGSRGDSAGITVIGAAAAAAYLWFRYPALLIAGGLLALGGAASLAAGLRRGRAWHEQDIMLRRLWAAVKRIPSGYLLTDPETGVLLTAERERGWLTLAVLEALARCDTWDSTRALAHAMRHHEPAMRASALIAIIPGLPDPVQAAQARDKRTQRSGRGRIRGSKSQASGQT